MANSAIISVLPVGEFDGDLVRSQFEATVTALDGLGADLVVVDPVSDVEGARQSVEALSRRNPDLLVIVALRGLSAPIMEAAGRMSRAPCLFWPVPGRFALPSSALAVGALREAGVAVELLYAPPDHPASIERIRRVTRAARAWSRLRQSRIGIIGGLFPNLVSCRYDPQRLSSRLGTTLLPITFGEIREAIESRAPAVDEIQRARRDIASSYAVQDMDPRVLDAGLQLHLALKQVARERQIDGFATECWTGFPRELGLNPCLGFIEDAYILGCEGDVMLCISLLLVRYLAGTSAFAADLYDLDLDGIVTLVHCGAPAALARSTSEVVLSKSQLALERGFETVTCRPRLQAGPVTLLRFYGGDCDKMHLALGELLDCEQSPGWSVKVRLAGSRFDFLAQCFGNHYVVVAGDIRSELKLLCDWFGVRLFET